MAFVRKIIKEELSAHNKQLKKQARLNKIEKLAEGLFLEHGGLSMSVCLLNATDAVDAIDNWRKEQEL